MSRKPTAISIGKKEQAAKAKRTAKPESSNRAARKAKAMKAPAPELAEDNTEAGSTSTDFNQHHVPFVAKGGSGWLALFGTCLIGLVTLGIGLWFTQLIEDLFLRNSWLGWAASGLLGLAALSLVVFVVREVFAIWRLRKLNRLREEVQRVVEDKAIPAQPVLLSLVGIYENRDDMQWALSRFASHQDDILDDRDRLLLAERYLMKSLDLEAQKIIALASKRVSMITAVNPAASLDVLFTGYQVLAMLRQLMALYGNRPGLAGTVRLAGMVGSHLAVTGGLALSDTLIQQFVGKGLAGRLSAKLGEGVVNGILTARIGLAAIEVCRPMPFREVEKPGLRQFASALAGSFSGTNTDENHDPTLSKE